MSPSADVIEKHVDLLKDGLFVLHEFIQSNFTKTNKVKVKVKGRRYVTITISEEENDKLDKIMDAIDYAFAILSHIGAAEAIEKIKRDDSPNHSGV